MQSYDIDIQLASNLYCFRRYYECGPVSGILFCAAVSVDYLLWRFLEWYLPRKDVDIAVDARKLTSSYIRAKALRDAAEERIRDMSRTETVAKSSIFDFSKLEQQLEFLDEDSKLRLCNSSFSHDSRSNSQNRQNSGRGSWASANTGFLDEESKVRLADSTHMKHCSSSEDARHSSSSNEPTTSLDRTNGFSPHEPKHLFSSSTSSTRSAACHTNSNSSTHDCRNPTQTSQYEYHETFVESTSRTFVVDSGKTRDDDDSMPSEDDMSSNPNRSLADTTRRRKR